MAGDSPSQRKVLERYPQAELMPFSAGAYDITTPSNRPSPGYRNSKVLGAGETPALAWADAAKRVLRRRAP